MVKAEGGSGDSGSSSGARCGDIAGVAMANQSREHGSKEGEKDTVAPVTAVRKPAVGSAGRDGAHSRGSLKRGWESK